MPVRTVTEEFCDVCYASDKQKQTPATQRVRFSWLGKNYLVLACDKHIDSVRNPLQHLSDIGSLEAGNRASVGRQRGGRPTATAATEFSQLSAEEKERFRTWADMPNARRIADARVREWTAAGRP